MTPAPGAQFPEPIPPVCPYCKEALAPTIGLYVWQIATSVIVGILCPHCQTLLHIAINPPRPPEAKAAAKEEPPADSGPRIVRPS